MRLFLSLFLFFTCCGGSYAQDYHRDNDAILPIGVIEPTLINGQPAPAGMYPATVRIRSGNSSCTAAVVGPRAVLSAAHCMGNGGNISFSTGGKSYSARCTHHGSYRGNSTADWAFCYTNATVTGIQYERLASKIYPVGTKIRLNGYGCVRPGGGGGNDGVLRIGDTTVIRSPSGTNYDTVTRQGAALCFGDSGGPAFVYENGQRYLIGVNSRGDIRTTSYLSTVSVSTAISFANSWSNNFSDGQICGIHSNAPNCRGQDNEPEPEPDDDPFEGSCLSAYNDFAFCLGIGINDQCLNLLDKLKSCMER